MSFPSYTRLLLVACALSCREKAAPPPAPTVELVVDDAARTVAIDRTISLASLVSAPPATWTFVRADARDARWLEIPDPATTYPGGELRFSRERGRVAFGVFVGDRPLVSLAPVVRVRVSTAPLAAAPAPAALTIVVRGEARVWRSEARETPLADVIGTRDLQRVRVIGDTEITLASIDHATLKTNQRGEFVLRVWDNGREHPTREVRRVTKLLVE